MLIELQEQKVLIQKFQTIAESNSLDQDELRAEVNSLKEEIELLKNENIYIKELLIRYKVITECDSSDSSIEYIDAQAIPIIENGLANNREHREVTQQPNIDYEDMDYTETDL